MALEGSVKDFGVVDIFQLIAMQKKTGLLTMSDENKTVFVHFVNGNIIRAFEGDENERFSNAMITAEKITIVQLRAALRIAENERPIGETFVKLAYLTQEEAKKWNQTLAQETIFDLFSWESGSYRFEPEEEFLKSDVYSPMSVERILMEGMRQKDEWPALLKKIPSRTMVFEMAAMPQKEEREGEYETSFENGEAMTDLFDTEEHAWLLQWIDGVRTVEGVINHAGVGAFPVYKCLAELLAIGKIKEQETRVEIKKHPITIDLFKQISFQSFFLNKVLVAFVLVLLTTLLLPSFYGVHSIFQKIIVPIEAFRNLTTVNEKDIIAFSLNLYYLKHHRYPATLNQLVEEGFLQTKLKEEIDFGKFLYRPHETTFELDSIK